MTQVEEATPVVDGEGIGARVQRVEDARFLTGQATYLADVQLPHTKHVAILRSPVAHARIRNVSVDRARALKGVVAAFTGAELAEVSHPFSHLLPIPTI